MTLKPKPLNYLTRLLKGLATLTLLPLLAGCVTKAGPVTQVITDHGCGWVKPIYVSRADVLTDGTARQIKDHDETGAKVCGWKPTTDKPKASK